ncbi:Flagellar basal-body rod protein FlgG [Polystyrenella longa]|uniref:Flagellar basal-body rod protein FlgG n=1 Tax=Polystyrenella longa TaxID=2528007 RepID=A0A518CIW5_9PLAN|nr:flagellar basal-body rod protein FlgG [Polystyrenella longa]QDU79134.1 Flagellar basal-body rod protein FlgG [Polystyrenella longa]
MSLRSLHSAASGMQANNFQLDVIANNIANSGTTGFKQSRANFEDVYYEHLKLPGVPDAQGNLTPIGKSVGLGTKVSGTQIDFTQGPLNVTEGQLDLAIAGEGFFEVVNPDGGQGFTRNGAFTLNSNGQVVLASSDVGRVLQPNITIPLNAQDVSIGSDGQVTYRLAGDTALTQAGQIQTTRFANSGGLLQVGDSIYVPTDASGAPVQGIPGTDGYGQIRQNYLEESNVEPVKELVGLIKTQRNFELNSQVVQAADQALQLLANLRRF